MNKKFTMMLAAFVAAGYTITAEAGVVKVTSPTANKAYIIATSANGSAAPDALADGVHVLSAEAAALKVVKLGEDLSVAEQSQWELTGDFGGSFQLAFTGLAKSNFLNNSGASNYTWGIGATDNMTNSNGAIQADEGHRLKISSGSVADDASGDIFSYFTVYADAKVNGIVIPAYTTAGKYIVVTTTDGDSYTVAEKSKEEIQAAALESNAMWKTDAEGRIESVKYAGVYLTSYTSGSYSAAKTQASALILNDVDDTNYTIASVGGAASKENITKKSCDKNVLAVTTPSNVPTNVELVKAAGSLVNVRLTLCTSGAKSNYIAQADQAALNTKADYSKTRTKDFHWTYNSTTGKFTNASGVELNIDGVNKFKVSFNEDGYITLKNWEGTKAVCVDSNDKLTMTATSNELAVFAATPAVEDAVVISEFNEKVQGAFSVTYKIGDDVAESNPFENVTAIQLTSAVDKYGNGVVYLVKDAPADATTKKDWKKEDLDKLTFVAVSPAEKHESYATNTLGLAAKLIDVKGSDLVASTSTEKGKVTVANASFAMTSLDVVSESMIFNMAGAVKVNSGDKLVESATGIVVAAVKTSAGVIVTTTNRSENITMNYTATMGSENIVEYADFLKDAPKVFNIQFLSTVAVDKDETKSECNKYLGLGYNESAKVVAQGSDFVDLNAPQNQWVVTKMTEDNLITFKNREGGQEFSAKLVKTEQGADIYRLASVPTTSQLSFDIKYINRETGKEDFTEDKKVVSNMIVKLVPVTVDMMAGYVSDELDNMGLVKMSFNVENAVTAIKLYLNEESNTIKLNKDKSTQFEIVKFEADTIFHKNKYAYLKDAKPAQKEEDKLAVVTYAFKQYRTDNEVYCLNSTMGLTKVDASTSQTIENNAQRFVVKINKDGSYSLIPVSKTEKFSEILDNNTFDLNASSTLDNVTISYNNNIYANHTAKFQIEGEAWNASYNHVPQHVMFQNGNSYMAVSEAGAAIMEAPSALKAEYTKADLTFWLDTTDNKAAVPTFYISKGAKEYMFNATDSLTAYNEGTASLEDVKEYMMPGFDNVNKAEARAIFRAATLKDSKTLVTSINGKETELTKAEDLANYQYKIVLKDEAADDEYVVRSLNGYSYLYETNGQLGFTGSKDKAIVFTIERVEAPTSNEGVAASEVKVVAQNGSVVVKNAAGKNVVVSTILGQVVANEVLTSDNATINVPAGIVVVAVEGESFKVNVK